MPSPTVSTTYIKHVQIGDVLYPIDALKFAGKTEEEWLSLIEAGFSAYVAWSDYDFALANPTQSYFESKNVNVPYGVQLYWDNGDEPDDPSLAPAFTKGQLTAANADKNKIYLVAVGGGNRTKYDEYIAAQETNLGVTSWVWERLGSTDVDVSNLARKDEAAKAGTYTTSEASTVTTGSGGSGTATGTATITVPVQTVTSTSAGGVTIQGSNFGFSGSTGTITIGNNTNDHVWIDRHKYQPAGTIGGSATVPSHGHTYSTITMVTPSKITAWSAGSLPSVTPITVVTGNGGTPSIAITELTSTSASVLTGVKASSTTTAVTGISTSGSAFVTGYSTTPDKTSVVTGVSVNSSDTAIKSISSGTTSVFNSATVSSAGVLSFNSTDVLNSVSAGSTFTAVKGITASGTTYCVVDIPSLSTATALTGVTKDTATVVTGVGANGTTNALTSVGAGATAAVLNSLATATAYMFSNTTTARGSLPSLTYEGATAINSFVLQDAPSVTINGSNFTFTGTTATLGHGVTGTPTTATADQLWVDIATRTINFTPTGSITGSQTVSGHSHNVTIGATTVVGTAAVAVSNHTHSMGHTHTVTLPNCEA